MIVFSTVQAPGLMQVSDRGGEATPLTRPVENEIHSNPQFLPDGRTLSSVSAILREPGLVLCVNFDRGPLTQAAAESMYSDRRYRVAGHERSRPRRPALPAGADPEDIDDAASGDDPDAAAPMFSPSRQKYGSHFLTQALTQ